jgi:hypothetical protein
VATFTVTDCAIEPPFPVHVRVYDFVLERPPVDSEPAVAFVTLHAPEAVQLFASVVDHASIDELPFMSKAGVALNESVGAGVGSGFGSDALTFTVTDCAIEPPFPVHVSVYVFPAVSAPVESLPTMLFAPLHAPLAVHAVAFVAAHVSVAALPLWIEDGDALNESVGVGRGRAVPGNVIACVPMCGFGLSGPMLIAYA